ncbi:MAG: hypothetical protein IJY60_01115 [Bacteroides sp.]|nr:hypothetical protein [Bacteroides sp.]MBQ8873903.1 hypothetical protein [Bacteroides sp.]
MKKIGLSALLALAVLAGCGDGGEKEAQMRLRKAEAALQQENFSEAKLQIDSIKVLYPKAFEARKQGIKLMQQVDLKEQRKTLVYLDSMMQVKQLQLDSIKGNFVLEKDTAYQEIGNWFYPTQVVEKNTGRTFLRGQVSELGEMSLTSIYCAGGALNHTSVKVSVGDTFAETPATKDSYTTTDLGRTIEKADYKLGEDGGVAGFIVANADKNIQLTFVGDKTYKTAMQKNDRKAIVELTELARILSGMEEIRKQQKEANLKIQFVTRKMEEAKAAEVQE